MSRHMKRTFCMFLFVFMLLTFFCLKSYTYSFITNQGYQSRMDTSERLHVKSPGNGTSQSVMKSLMRKSAADMQHKWKSGIKVMFPSYSSFTSGHHVKVLRPPRGVQSDILI